ncbi:MAG: hypothetical protein OSB05_00275 [Akkermansiaceae bacterium]|nr:hypothetical protein [Akkermansiaceae bacterium]
MGAMLDMMGQMMGKGKKEGKDSDSESQEGGEGNTGESDSANTKNNGASKDKTNGERRVPRSAGKSGTKLPAEFQKALDGYNKTAKKK